VSSPSIWYHKLSYYGSARWVILACMARKSFPRGIIIFTRFPEPGLTKTRLISALGAEGACRLHRTLTEKVIAQVQGVRNFFPLQVEIHFSGGSREQMAGWLGRDWEYVLQSGSDLGTRMEQAFLRAFRQGWKKVVLIGSDLPDVTAALIREAFRQLADYDLVLGPARDGGYYLIGLKENRPELFRDHISWGTAEVLKKTRATADRLGLTIAYLAMLRDVDRPEDLAGLPLATVESL